MTDREAPATTAGRERAHVERTASGRHFWRCVPKTWLVEAEASALAIEAEATAPAAPLRSCLDGAWPCEDRFHLRHVLKKGVFAGYQYGPDEYGPGQWEAVDPFPAPQPDEALRAAATTVVRLYREGRLDDTLDVLADLDAALAARSAKEAKDD